MLLGAKLKRFDTIVEFAAFENFCSFDKKGKNKEYKISLRKFQNDIVSSYNLW